jgi:N-dimethylarginine dimethylaminohydrolase
MCGLHSMANMARTIMMGDPRYFSVRGGANPHTRNALGMKKHVDPDKARRQWHMLARTLITHGVEVIVGEPHEHLTGLVYPANAGFLYPLEGVPAKQKKFYLANLLPTRAAEREVYRAAIEAMGFVAANMDARFEGEADFFPAGPYMIFTYGHIERQRFVPRLGLPPWKRIYGFRSNREAIGELQRIVGDKPILPLELRNEAYYHGDTVLCSFGPRREFLLAYMDGLAEESRLRLHSAFGENLVELTSADAAVYAANSFQIISEGRCCLFVPVGLSQNTLAKIRERNVQPVAVDVSEFLAKGGGSIKCMILDLGPSDEQPSAADPHSYRALRNYERLFGTGD